ncbi:MAG TPA: hypothetical protein PLR18_01110 [bacterium]|nr:hypothetical protein [bacterium]
MVPDEAAKVLEQEETVFKLLPKMHIRLNNPAMAFKHVKPKPDAGKVKITTSYSETQKRRKALKKTKKQKSQK